MCTTRLLTVIALSACVAASMSARTAADDVPKLDIGASCRAAAVNEAALKTCLADEDRARARLAGEWGRYAPAETTHCTQLSSMKGFQSYVELLTCLEMASEAKKLPKDITQQ